MLFGCSNFPNSATVQFKIIEKDGTLTQDWIATGVIERVISDTVNMSIYQIDTTLINSGFEGWIFWRTSDELYTASELISLADSQLFYPSGAVVTDAANTAQMFKTDLASSTNDVYKDSFLLFISGALIDQQKKITTYLGSTKFITVVNPFTAAPTAADKFKVINR